MKNQGLLFMLVAFSVIALVVGTVLVVSGVIPFPTPTGSSSEFKEPTIVYPNVKAMVTAVEAYIEPTMSQSELLEIVSDDISAGELETFLDNPMPVLVGWRLLYRDSSNARSGVEAVILDDGTIETRSKNLSESQANQRAITRWAIDMRQLLDVVDRNDVNFLEGLPFRLTMLNVNGIYRPVWYVPYQLKNGSEFVVDAATGQLLCQIEGQPNEWNVCDVE